MATKETREELIKKFKLINEEFKKNNIKWLAHSGTLLGAIRNNGKIIPWDHDIDMSMSYKIYFEKKDLIDKILKKHNSELHFLDKENKSNMGRIFSNDFKDTGIDIMFSISVTNEKNSFILRKKSFVPSYHGFIISKTGRYFFILRLIIPVWFTKYVIKKQIKKDISRNFNNEQIKYDAWMKRGIIYKYDELIEVEFENTKVLINKRWEDELVRSYGKNWKKERIDMRSRLKENKEKRRLKKVTTQDK